KVTLVKPTEAPREEVAPEDSERAEILRKLEESRQRNLSEQQRLAEADKRRAEEAERKRREEEAARLEAERAAAEAAALPPAEEIGRKAHGHGHPKPAARAEDKGARHKTRGSHAMVAGPEDDERTARFAGKMHLSAADRARRSTSGRGKPKSRRHAEQARSGTGFTRPTAPIVREVAIGEAITVADLAQKLAMKGGDVVKALFKMGVMATINQALDHDTAVLVV